MAEERNDDQFDTNASSGGQQQTTGQQSQQSEYGQQQNQQPSMSGQAIGGNDSETGSGTTLSQGADFNQDSDQGGGQYAASQSQQSTGGSDATTLDQVGQVTRSGAGYGDQGGSSDNTASTGEGFIGSQGSGSDDYLQERGEQASDQSSSASATDGSDFASQGQGSLDEDDESGSGSTGGGAGMTGGGGSGGF